MTNSDNSIWFLFTSKLENAFSLGPDYAFSPV